jgi:hypothetical protein
MQTRHFRTLGIFAQELRKENIGIKLIELPVGIELPFLTLW